MTAGGETEDAAIVNALVEAVRQVRGISLESEKTLRTSLIETEAQRDLRVELRDSIRSRSSGQIQTYEVLSVERQDNRWQARLSVTLPQYASPGADRSHMRSLALLPFRCTSSALGGGATSLTPRDIARRWEQKVVSHFTQSRRFRMLDREFSTELDAEDARLRVGQVPVAEFVRLGQQIGADYVITGEIPACHLRVANDGETLEEATLVVEYRIVELAIREVRWADTETVSLGSDWLVRTGVSRNRPLALDRLVESAANSIVTTVVDLIYPVKVLKVDEDGTVLLSQGGNRVQPGQWFSVRSGDEKVMDPDNRLPVHVDGKEAAVVVVIESLGKYARARLDHGSSEALAEGMVCRRLSREQLAAAERQGLEVARREQEKRMAEGKCPRLIVRAWRSGTGWQFAVKNLSNRAVNINGLTKRIAGVVEASALTKALRAGGEEAFGLPYPFSSGDAVEFHCDDFDLPYVYFFP